MHGMPLDLVSAYRRMGWWILAACSSVDGSLWQLSKRELRYSIDSLVSAELAE